MIALNNIPHLSSQFCLFYLPETCSAKLKLISTSIRRYDTDFASDITFLQLYQNSGNNTPDDEVD